MQNNMLNYRAWGLEVASEVPIPGWRPRARPSTAPHIVVRRAQVPHCLEGGEAAGPLHQIADDRHLFALPGLGRCLIAKGGVVDVHQDESDEAGLFLLHLATTVAAIALEQRNIPVLCGAAVVVGERCVLLLGEPQAGKSTLAARLLSAGGTIVSDGILALETDGDGAVRVLPGWGGVVLWHNVLSLTNQPFESIQPLPGRPRSACHPTRPPPSGGAKVTDVMLLASRSHSSPTLPSEIRRASLVDAVTCLETLFVCRRLSPDLQRRRRWLGVSAALVGNARIWQLDNRARGHSNLADLDFEPGLIMDLLK